MPIDNTLLSQIKSNDPALETLTLSHQRLNENDIRELVKALASNTALTTLNVEHNQIGVEGAKALAANTTLATLHATGNQIGTEGAKALATNTTLNTLLIGNNEIGAEGAKALAANTTLTALYIQDNQIGVEGARALAMNTSLITLDIGSNHIGNEGAKALATNTTLTALDTYNNQIGDEGAKALAMNATLTALDIMNNQIGAEGAKVLATNTSFTTLNIGDNQIGNEGAKALASNTILTTLNVGYNQIGEEEGNYLKQAIARNNQQVVSRRSQFIQKLLILANDKANSASRSLWSSLPKELMLHIISFIDFRSIESIGKSAQQIKACAEFIFNHAPQIKATLAESVKTKQDLKIMEKMQLTDEIEELKAALRKREQQLFGKTSEKNTTKSENKPDLLEAEKTKKKRGQPIGSAGHSRRDYSHLPTTEEVVSVSDKSARCPCCGLPYQELPES